ncbi:MAG: phosphomannomutase/phosphoglucomutase [Gammaproteobacteria bacterium]|nr:MAG: phosphomannomutase/phosphoglucomutase [Gammaproteobacteria bacterium]
MLAAAFAGLALLLAAAVLGPWAYRRGLAGDQALLLRALRDVRHGGLKSEYPIRMVESLPLLKGLVQLFAEPPAVSSATAGTPSPTPAPSPAAPEPEPADPFEVLDEQALQAPPATPPDEAPEDHARPAAPTAAGTAEPPPVDPALFRAYDIRGIHGRTLTAEVAEQIGRAVGSDALARGETALFVGRDGRLSSPELAAALIRGLCATGIQVKDLGEVPTPVLYYAAHRGEESSSGVMVTGSHNPPEYNGMKIVIAGETLHGAAIQALRHLIEHQTFMQGRGGVESVALVEDYVQAVTADVRLARPLRVAVDCSHGVTAHVVPRLLAALGCEAFPIHCEVDGRFPAHPPDPGHPEHLAGLVQAVQAHQADIGIAFDGDGDRLGVVDSEGNYIWPDRLMMLLAMDVLSRNPGADILFDVKCSRHLPRIIRDFGGNPEMWKTGHSRLKARMKETGALLAGELSGHLFYADRWYGFDDALYAAARLLEILAADHRPSARIFAVLPASPATPLIEVPVPEGEGPRLVERLREAAEFPDAEEVITLDGLRVEFADGWGLVRASNTTPALTLRFEADDAAALERIQQRFRDLLQTVAPGITLPF